MNFKKLTKDLKNLFQTFTAPASDLDFEPEIGEDGTVRANKNWKPNKARRRIEIMLTGDPSRVGVVADAIDDVQKQVFEGAEPTDNIELRITGFLDGCIHRSKWNKKSFKAAAEAKKWECKQSKTKFSDAFKDSKGELVDTVVLIGHRFDEDAKEALRKATELKEQGVKIHCFHTGIDKESRAVYEQIAEETGGVFLQLTDQSSIGKIMPILMTHFKDDDEAILALNPKDQESKKLLRMLNPERPEVLEAPQDKSDEF